MKNRRCVWITVAFSVLLPLGFQVALAGEQGRGTDGLPVTSPGAYQIVLSNTPPVENSESGTPELGDIQRRLRRLETQNLELARQNEQLRDRLEAGSGGERLSAPTPDGTVTPVSAAEPLANQAQAESATIGAEMLALKQGLERIGAGVEQLGEHLTVTTAHNELGFKLAVFGALSTELICADARPLIPSAVAEVSPDFGRNSQIAEVSARSSYLGAAAIGPCVGSFQSGGLFLAYFYSSSILDDNYGFFVARAYGELKNDFWRFSAGLDGDVINPFGRHARCLCRVDGGSAWLSAETRTRRVSSEPHPFPGWGSA